MSDDSYEELPDSCWDAWEWPQYHGLEDWQWMGSWNWPWEIQ